MSVETSAAPISLDTEAQTPALVADLLRLKELLERTEIDAARASVEELVERWPALERVRDYARVLAPPSTRTIPGDPGRSLDPNHDWFYFGEL